MDKENTPKKPLPSIRDSSRFGTGLFSAPLDPEILSEVRKKSVFPPYTPKPPYTPSINSLYFFSYDDEIL